MAAFDLDNEDVVIQNAAVPETHVFRTNDELKTSTLFDKDIELNTIVQYIKGMDWQVDYFLQIRNINDHTYPPDINKPATVQKYNRINKLILKVQTGINQDDYENITGEAVINAGFLPAIGDAFTATLTGGREAIFVLDTVTKKNYNLQPVYFVTFKLFTLLDNNNIEIYNDLVYKTIREYIYDKEHLLDYSSPVILASDYRKKLNLKTELEDMVEHYLKHMINKEKNVLAVPSITSIYYDNLIVDFIFKILSVSDNILMQKITKVDFEENAEIGYTIWDAIVTRDIRLLKYADKDIGFKYTPISYGISGVSRHASYLDINFIVDKVEIGNRKVPALKENRFLDNTLIPISASADVSYVLGENFYALDLTKCSVLEKAVIRYIKGELTNIEELEQFIIEYKHWDYLTQFYLLPIIIVLTKDCINNTFSPL